MRNTAVVVLMFLATAPAFADQSAPNPQATAKFGALRQKESPDPYSSLFKAREVEAQDLLKAAQAQLARTEKTKRRVVCGMTIIEADPAVDPKMVAEPSKSDGIEYTIRSVEPPICNPAK